MPCNMGVGCDEAGVCYAMAHGQPDMCCSILEISIMALQPHEQRVVAERDELVIKVQKLADFTTGSVYTALSEIDQVLLTLQLTAMQDYLLLLNRRISRFGG